MTSADDARRVAAGFGYPVVLKGLGKALMHKTERNLARRADPKRILPECRSILALAMPYTPPEKKQAGVAAYAAGLDYPGVGPEHAWLKDSGRARYDSVTDAEALAAFHLLTRTEGIIPAPEATHAVVGAIREAERCRRMWTDSSRPPASNCWKDTV